MRSVSGGLPDMTNTHAAQTSGLSGQRTRFWPTKFAPMKRSTSTPRVDSPAHIQQRNGSCGVHVASFGDPARS